MRSGDLSGDLGQRGITRPGVLEAIFCHRYGMNTATPLADKTRAWLQGEAWRWANATCLPQVLDDRLQFATRRPAEPALIDLLKSIAEPKNEEVTAKLRWLTVVETSPFTA